MDDISELSTLMALTKNDLARKVIEFQMAHATTRTQLAAEKELRVAEEDRRKAVEAELASLRGRFDGLEKAVNELSENRQQRDASADKAGDIVMQDFPKLQGGVKGLQKAVEELERQLSQNTRTCEMLAARKQTDSHLCQVAIRTSVDITPDALVKVVDSMGISSNLLTGVVRQPQQRKATTAATPATNVPSSSTSAPAVNRPANNTLWVIKFASSDVAELAVRGSLRSDLRSGAGASHYWGVDDWLTPDELKQRRDLFQERDKWHAREGYVTGWRRAALVVARKRPAGQRGRLDWKSPEDMEKLLAASQQR